MNRFALLTGILALAAPLALAQATTTWTSDPAHSAVEFSVQHLTISTVEGHFGNVAATIQLNSADISKSTVSATIGVGTIDSGSSSRDDVLRSSSFFDVEKFPTASFASTSVARSGNRLTVRGNLTLRGVSRPVVLTVEGPAGPILAADHKLHAGYTATTTIDRIDFGIGAAYPSTLIGDAVKLTIDLEVIQQ